MCLGDHGACTPSFRGHVTRATSSQVTTNIARVRGRRPWREVCGNRGMYETHPWSVYNINSAMCRANYPKTSNEILMYRHYRCYCFGSVGMSLALPKDTGSVRLRSKHVLHGERMHVFRRQVAHSQQGHGKLAVLPWTCDSRQWMELSKTYVQCRGLEWEVCRRRGSVIQGVWGQSSPSCLTRAGLSRGAGQRDAATFTLPYVFVSPPSGCSILSSLSLPRRGGGLRAWGTV